MKINVLFLLFFIVFSVNGQFGKKSKLEKIDSVFVLSRSDIDEKDWLLTFTTPILFPCSRVSTSSFLFDLGGDFRLKSFKYGGLNFDYAYSIFITETKLNGDYYGNRLINRNNFSLQYSLPLFNQTIIKNSIASIIGPTGYYNTNLDAKKQTIINLILGYSQVYNTSVTDKYMEILYKTYDQITPQGAYNYDLRGWIDQSVSMGQFGFSFDRTVNSNMICKDKNNQIYEGRLTNTFSFYNKINFAFFTDISKEISYAYKVPLVGGISGQTQIINEDVDITEYVPLRKLGMSLGIEYTSFRLDKRYRVNKIGLELGSLPGYYDYLGRSLYVKVKFIGIGFGFMTNKLKDEMKAVEKDKFKK